MVVVARNLKHWTWPFGTRNAFHLSEKQKTREKVHLCFRLIKPITITNDELGLYHWQVCCSFGASACLREQSLEYRVIDIVSSTFLVTRWVHCFTEATTVPPRSITI